MIFGILGFGYTIPNNEMAEWGYISFAELRAIRIPSGFEIDYEVFDPTRKASEFDKIRIM